MAKDDKKNSAAIAPHAAGAMVKSNELPKALSDEGFKLVNPDCFFYKCVDPNTPAIAGKPVDPNSINVLRGFVIDRRQRPPTPEDTAKKRDPGFYFLFLLTAPSVLYNHSKEAVQAMPGMLAWVDERYDLRELAERLPKRDSHGNVTAVSEVVLTPQELVKVKMGTMWKIQVAGRSVASDKTSVPLLDVSSVATPEAAPDDEPTV